MFNDDSNENFIESINSASPIDAIFISQHPNNKLDLVQLTNKIKNDQNLKNIPLILLISRFKRDNIDKDLEMKFAKIISKPARDVNLFNALLEVFEVIETKGKQTPGKLEEIIKNGKRVLVCDDNKINLRVAEMFLGKVGYEVDCVENGQEGVNKFLHIKYDIVLMDCQMPIMDGFVATKTIRDIEKERGSKRKIPIIALTGNVTEADKKMCFDNGMDDFLTKPVMRDRLFEIVNYWLEEEKEGTIKGPVNKLIAPSDDHNTSPKQS